MAAVTTADLHSEEFYNSLIVPALNANSVVLRSIRQILTGASKVNIPIIDQGTVGWVAEGATLTDADFTPDLVQVVPKKLTGFADLSNETVLDAGAAEIVGSALAQALARGVDAAFFVSGGASAPTALASATTLTVDATPTAGTDAYTDAAALMENAGASPSVIFVNPLDWAILSKIKEATGSNKPVLVAQAGPTAAATRSLNGLPVEVSAGCPQGTAYVVDGSRVVAVVRTDGAVEADKSVGFRNDLTVLRAIGRFGFAVLYPSAACRIKDIA